MIQKIEEGMCSLTLTGSALKRQNHDESVNLRVTRRRRSKRVCHAGEGPDQAYYSLVLGPHGLEAKQKS